MDKISLNAQVRKPGEERAADLRREGVLPLVCYGHGFENKDLKVGYQDFRRAYIKAGESTLIELQVEGEKEPVKVLVHEVDYDPVSGDMIHVDLILVNMKEKITTYIPLKFVGMAPAEKTAGGVLIYNKEEIEVKCLPGDLVHEVEVDLSVLENIHDSIKVGDVKFPEKLEVLDDADLPVVTVTEVQEESDEPAEAPETIVAGQEEKKEGEEVEEGAEK